MMIFLITEAAYYGNQAIQFYAGGSNSHITSTDLCMIVYEMSTSTVQLTLQVMLR